MMFCTLYSVQCVSCWSRGMILLVFTSYLFQCCGSGSGIRCLFDPWTRIRDRFFPDPGSQTRIF
jgi:hypothetical protein